MTWPVRVAWSETTAARLGEALGNDMVQIRRDVERGAAELWEWPGHGLTVIRLEDRSPEPPELVVVAAQGVGLTDFWGNLQHIARLNGARTVRAHTAKPGMVRLMERLGFRPFETVLRAEI